MATSSDSTPKVHSNTKQAILEATPAPPKVVTFNTLTKVISHVFDSRSTDCCFQFINDETHELTEIVAHRRLLAALSPVFAAMFGEAWCGDGVKTPTITIDDAAPEAFQVFLDYFYKGAIELSADNVDVCYYLAHKYDINDLQCSCIALIIDALSPDNVISYYKLAERFDEHGLRLACVEYMGEHTEPVLLSTDFRHCDKATLTQILSLPKMSCGQLVVFCACAKWAESACRTNNLDEMCAENVRAQLGDAIKMIRFDDINLEQLASQADTLRKCFTLTEVYALFRRSHRMEAIAAAPRLDGEVLFDFEAAGFGAVTKCAKTQIEFRLSQAAMLAAVTFVQPKRTDDYAVLRSAAVVSVEQRGRVLANVRLRPGSQTQARCHFPKPVRVLYGEVYKIKVNILTENASDPVDIWFRQYAFAKCHRNGVRLTPMNGSIAMNSYKSFVSALHFQV